MRLSQIELDDADQADAELSVAEVLTTKRMTITELRALARRKRAAFDGATKWTADAA
jgi:hypothetical protein